MKKHWYWVDNGEVKESDANLYGNRDHGNTLWDFDPYNGLKCESDLCETRAQALNVAINWCYDQINALEQKVDALMKELSDETQLQ